MKHLETNFYLQRLNGYTYLLAKTCYIFMNIACLDLKKAMLANQIESVHGSAKAKRKLRAIVRFNNTGWIWA